MTTPLAFLGLGVWEMVAIGVVALLLFGPRLPKVARSVGQSLVELRKGLREASDMDELEPPKRKEVDHEAP